MDFGLKLSTCYTYLMTLPTDSVLLYSLRNYSELWVSTRHIAQLLPGLSNRMLLKFLCQYTVYCKLTEHSVLQVDSTQRTANLHLYRKTSSGSRLTAPASHS
jgi:hypothetical protein